ncbi:MAG: FAD-dependent oxidoreductase, partial [Anaerolinea sp.]|nr:FAD-dependent oxidoreductase [Anaerolinea sp.]
MTNLVYDVIVLGAGALGSAAAYHAAQRGARVLVLEQFEIDHQRGSSYGYSRIIRYVYDHPIYVRMAGPAFALWRALEAEAGEALYIRTGGIDFGVPGTEAMFDGMIATLRAEGIDHELLTPDEAHRRFPQFHFDDDMTVLYQTDTGILRASRCVQAHVRLAQAHGAVVLENTRVDAIHPTADGVRVRAGEKTYSAARLIVTAGGWAGPLLRTLDLDLPLRPVKAQENYFDV